MLDRAPALALLGMWLGGGLAGALTILQATGDPSYLVLGLVTLPALALIGRALRSRPSIPP